jgi:hypothetical protein
MQTCDGYSSIYKSTASSNEQASLHNRKKQKNKAESLGDRFSALTE